MSSGAETNLSRASYKSLKTPKIGINRKLEMEFIKMTSSSERRRIKSDHSKMTSSSSSVSSDASDVEDETHIDRILIQSRKDLENTQALQIRRHLLHSGDFVS